MKMSDHILCRSSDKPGAITGYAFTTAMADLAMDMKIINSPGDASTPAPPAGSTGLQMGNCSSLYKMTGVLNWGIENVTMGIDMTASTSSGQAYSGMNVSLL